MRICVAVLCASAIACGGGGLFRQYEYEEEMYLSLDGAATLNVNSSIAALNALRGTSFDASPSGRLDRDAVREYFSSPRTRVTRVTQSRRSGRRFVHVRLEVDDVRRLNEARPFAWSTYRFARDGEQLRFDQTVGSSSVGSSSVGSSSVSSSSGGSSSVVSSSRPDWTGRDLVAFRMHLPSKIEYHNTPTHEVGRGNILAWEQLLTDRLRGVPLTIEARMQTQSILYRTLWLFGVTFVVVAVLFVTVIWWILRRGKPAAHAFGQSS